MRTPARFFAATVIAALFGLAGGAATAQQAPGFAKRALELTRDKWVAFRNFNGRQLIYFTQIVTYKCGLKEVRYSFNTRDVAERFQLPRCDPQNPFRLDPQNDKIYLSLAPGTVGTMSVQLVYGDGTASKVHTFAPCVGKGDATCGVPID